MLSSYKTVSTIIVALVVQIKYLKYKNTTQTYMLPKPNMNIGQDLVWHLTYMSVISSKRYLDHKSPRWDFMKPNHGRV